MENENDKPATENGSAASVCHLRRFNPRRALRGVPAAEVMIDSDLLWMSRIDISRNRVVFGDLPGLVKAAEHYRTTREYRGVPDQRYSIVVTGRPPKDFDLKTHVVGRSG